MSDNSERNNTRRPGSGSNRHSIGGGMRERGMSFEKPKDFIGSWRKLIKYCINYIPVIVIALVIAALGTVLQFLGPDRIKDMTNEIMKGLPALVEGAPILGAVDLKAVANIGLLLVFMYSA